MKQIAPHIYVKDNYRGVTVGCIVTDAGVICIDSPMLPADARDWRAQIARLSPKPVRFVVLTDANRDRILGVQYLGGTVVAHEVAWEKIKSLGDAFRQQAADSLAPCNADAAEDRRRLAHRLPANHVHQQAGPVPWRCPGRDPTRRRGNAGERLGSLTQAEHTVHGRPGDAERSPAGGRGRPRLLARCAETSPGQEFPAKLIIPGRGSPCNKAALGPTAAYLRTMRARVQAHIRSRKPRADLALLVSEFLGRYPVADDDLDCIQRRIRAGLDHIYDALKSKK